MADSLGKWLRARLERINKRCGALSHDGSERKMIWLFPMMGKCHEPHKQALSFALAHLPALSEVTHHKMVKSKEGE